MKATSKQIKWIEAQLVAGLPTIRKAKNRQMLREAVLRIRQLRGILQLREQQVSTD